jgi:hypothetical protein
MFFRFDSNPVARLDSSNHFKAFSTGKSPPKSNFFKEIVIIFVRRRDYKLNSEIQLIQMGDNGWMIHRSIWERPALSISEIYKKVA